MCACIHTYKCTCIYSKCKKDMLIYESTMHHVGSGSMDDVKVFVFIRTFPIFYSDVNCFFNKNTKGTFFFLNLKDKIGRNVKEEKI